MNPSETTVPLYPTQTAPHRAGELVAWREGTLGDRWPPQAYGARESAYENGIFGHGLGEAPTAEGITTVGEPRAYRDGLFNQVVLAPSHAERVTAFRDGIFRSPMGQDESGSEDATKWLLVGAIIALNLGIAVIYDLTRSRR